MKKKLIESMDAPKIPKGKTGVIGIARTPEEGLFTIDVVNVNSKEIYVRICLSKTEYMNYFPDKGIWNSKKIEYLFCEELQLGTEYIYMQIVNNSKLTKFMEKDTIWQYQNNLDWKKRQRAVQYRADRCKQRNSTVRELNDAEKRFLLQYVEEFHFLYYRRKGRKVQLACSACGKQGEYYVDAESPIEMIRTLWDTPYHNNFTDCPMCNKRVQYKAAGKTKGTLEIRDSKYIVQGHNGGLVVRYFEPQVFIVGDELHAKESTSITEVARVFFKDRKEQKDYHKCDWMGKLFWDDCNLAGMANITMKAGKVYKGNFDEIEQSEYKYACVREKIFNNDYINIIGYLGAYNYLPALEMMHKLGMTKLKHYVVEYGRYSGLFNPNGKNGPEIFKISKQRFNDMVHLNGDENMLRLFQYEKKHDKRFTNEEIHIMQTAKVSIDQLQHLLRYATPVKLVNYMKKQSRSSWREYGDYIDMCERNNRDMSNPHKVYPEDLHEAHQRELTAYNIMQEKVNMEQKNKQNPNIKKKAAEYNRIYKYQDTNYIIRAPRDAAEIVKEGAMLDHCVGRMGYIEAMNRGETVILFLRKKSDKNTPYYTVEVKDGKIQQAYGKGDKKPDWDDVKPFMDAFKNAKLKNNEITERKVG